MANKKNSSPENVEKSQDAQSLGRFIKFSVACAAAALVVVYVGVFIISYREAALTDGVPSETSEGEGDSDSPSLPAVELPVEPIEIANDELQEELVREIDLLLERFPDVPEALHVSAMGYAGLRQTQKAESYWRTCIVKAPRHVGPRLGLATVLSEQGDDEQAVEILEKALDDGCVSPELYFRLATSQTRLGDLEGAEAILTDAVRIYPNSPQNWLLLGQTESQLLQFEDAEKSVLQAIECGHETSYAYLALANACQRLGKTEEAETYRERFSELRAQGDNKFVDMTFQEIYQKALRPMTAGVLTMAAAVYGEEGDEEEERRLCLRSLALDPESVSSLEQLISSYRKAEEFLEASAVQTRLIEIEPNNPFHLCNLASLQEEMRDFESAVESLEKAKILAPRLAFPSLGLAQLYVIAGDLPKARSYAEDAVACEPSFQTYDTLAVICREMGDTEAADDARAQAVRLGSLNP